MNASQDKPDSTRFALLDLLRLFAALMVVAFHWMFRGHAAGQQITDFPDAARLAVYGYVGVDWFFVISGFVIAWTAEGRNAATFAVLRFARLYPGYIACMTITFLMTVSYNWPQFSPGWTDWLANITMFAPVLGRQFMDGAYWSIVVEIVFYGWVFLGLATGLWNKRIPIAFVWLAMSVANMVLIKSEALRFVLITDFAPWFVIGMMIQDIWKRGVKLEVLVILVTAFFASCLSLAVQVPIFAKDYGVAPDLMLLFSLNLLGILLIIAAINARISNQKIARWSVFAGAVSYPLYLFHQHAGYMLIDRFSPVLGGPGAMVLALAATFAVAVSTALLIEKPLRPVIIRTLLRIIERGKNILHWPRKIHAK
jgi:peptidoglycan/LPS O-acetylase OafA/YrhL